MEEIMKNFAQVTIYNERLSVTQIEEVPAYTSSLLLSDIGKHTSNVECQIQLCVW